MTAGTGGRTTSRSLKVGAVQLPGSSDVEGRAVDWTRLLRPWVERAASAGCGLVAFPSLPLATPLEAEGFEAFKAAAAALAREHGIILLPGAVEGYAAPGASGADEPRPYFRQALAIAPDGSIIGEQRQTHVSPEEAARGLQAGWDLHVFALPPPAPRGLWLGLLVGLDAWYPEVGRILMLKGASLFVASVAMPAPYEPWRQVAAMWQQVQQNQVFAIEACAVGRWGEAEYAGRSAVLAPCEAVANGSGILAQAGIDAAALPVTEWAAGIGSAGSTEPALITAELDFDELQRTIDSYSVWEQQNPGFYRAVFPALYEPGAAESDGSASTGERGCA
ncbi:MAG: carbon-nitrogen hydrolase family protein [Myxococcales bacterium]|jgi:predicted amidohydrolase